MLSTDLVTTLLLPIGQVEGWRESDTSDDASTI